MNPENSRQPRFICRVVRGWIALKVERVDPNALQSPAQRHASTEPNNALGPMRSTPASRHVATCSDCQKYFGACDQLESSLRREAVHQRTDVPEGLEWRIMQALALARKVERVVPNALNASDQARTSTEPNHALGSTRSTFRVMFLSLAGAVAAMALVAAFFPHLIFPEKAESVVTASSGTLVNVTPESPVAVTVPAREGTLQERLLATVAPAAALLQKDPLQDEVDSVYSDAQSAVRFLALNFLPNTPERVVRRTS